LAAGLVLKRCRSSAAQCASGLLVNFCLQMRKIAHHYCQHFKLQVLRLQCLSRADKHQQVT
jgi:hypothetical protein